MVSETARLLASQYELLYFALIMLGACTGTICLTILIGANRIADALTANAKREQTQLDEDIWLGGVTGYPLHCAKHRASRGFLQILAFRDSSLLRRNIRGPLRSLKVLLHEAL